MYAKIKRSIDEGVAKCNLSTGSLQAENFVHEKNKVDAIINTLCEF